MADFATALKDGLKQAFCSVTAAEANLLEMYRKIWPVASAFPNIPGFYNNLFCNKPPSPPPAPPFAGGQCSTCYRITINFTVAGTGNGSLDGNYQQTYEKYGPIAAVNYRFVGSGGGRIAYLTITSKGNCVVPPGTATVTEDGTPFSVPTPGTVAITSVTVVRKDNAPDTCGNLPSPYPPYVPGSNVVNNNITYVDVGGNTLVVPVAFAFGYANISPNFNINVPFRVTLNGTLNVTGNINLSTGGIEFNFGGGDGTGNRPPGDSRPGDQPRDYYPRDTPPTPTNPTPDPSPPEQSDPASEFVIRAALVVTTAIDDIKATEILQDEGNPDIYAPRLGNINFFYRSGSLQGWSNDIPIKNTQAFIPVEFEGGAVDVRGTPEPGVTWTITPIYKRVEVPAQLMP